MPGDEHNQHKATKKVMEVDTLAPILQATFQHYFGMAMDHHTKAGTTSNYLLIVVGAIITLVTLDNELSGVFDFVSGLAVSVIGFFGIVWVWKQHERYHFWEHIAYEYQKELIKIVPKRKTDEPMLKMGESYYDAALEATAKEFGPRFVKKVRDRYLYVFLHGLIVVIGFGLMAVSAWGDLTLGCK